MNKEEKKTRVKKEKWQKKKRKKYVGIKRKVEVGDIKSYKYPGIICIF